MELVAKNTPQAGVDRRSFLKVSTAALGAAALGPALAGCSAGSPPSSTGLTTVSLACSAFHGSGSIQQLVSEFNGSQSRIKVDLRQLPGPNQSTEIHQQLVQSLGRRDGSLDVYMCDPTWVAEFAAAGWALELDPYVDASARSAFFKGAIEAVTYNGKMVAMPWFIDSGLLFYRTDLLSAARLEVPTTWDELATTAAALQNGGKAQFGYAFQGKQAETVVCGAVEYVAANRGNIIASDGRTVGIGEPAAVAGIQFMSDAIHKYKITPSSVLSWDEEGSRRPFTAGQVAFHRNWTYVWQLAQDPKESQVVGKVGVAPLPAFPGGRSAGCFGGYHFGVSASSKNKEAATDVLKWLTSPATQLKAATTMGLAPTLASVYDEPSLASAQPFMVKLRDIFPGATPRPLTPKYPQVSLVMQSQLSQALNAGGSVQGAMSSAASQISQIVS